MKKIFRIAATLVFAALLFAVSAAKADCSKSGVISRGIVNIIVSDEKPMATVIATVLNKNGNPVCGAKLHATTSRNQKGSGWTKGVDKVIAQGEFASKERGKRNYVFSDKNGQATFVLSTKQPAGTTVYILTDEGKNLGQKDGLPFSYTNPATKKG